MQSELQSFLQRLVASPDDLGALSAEEEHAILTALRGVIGHDGPREITAASTHAGAWSDGDLLTVGEAAAALRLSPRWLYRHAKTLPFARKLSRKVLRFSRVGITRWLTTRRP